MRRRGASAFVIGVLALGLPRPAQAGADCWTLSGVVCVFASGVDPLSCYDSKASCERWHPVPPDGCWTYSDIGGSCEFIVGGDRSACSVSETDCRQAHHLCWTPVDGECAQGTSPDRASCFPSQATCEGAGVDRGNSDCWMNEGHGCKRDTGLGSSACFLTEHECEQAGPHAVGAGAGGGGHRCWVRGGGGCMQDYGSGGSHCFGSRQECEGRDGCWVFHGGGCVYEGGRQCATASLAECERQHGLGRRLAAFLAIL